MTAEPITSDATKRTLANFFEIFNSRTPGRLINEISNKVPRPSGIPAWFRRISALMFDYFTLSLARTF